ncbi:glycosyltransferase family 2 protein [Vibrio alginolyticus]|nr:glycosyltransferase family 2 protein [Vibrio alginolyticus]
MNYKYKVTVCLCTYNRGYLVRDAINRVFEQDFQGFELIVVNDGSTDDTKELLESIESHYNNLKVINNQTNQGLSFSRNVAIKQASGEWFTFIDDDDGWALNYISEMHQNVNSNQGDCVFCGSLNRGVESYFEPLSIPLKSALLKGFTPPIGAQMYRTSNLKDIGGYNEEVKSGVDHDLWIRLSASELEPKAIFIPFALVRPDMHKLAHSNKMTLNIDKRVPGIASSLHIWEPQLKKIGGEEFYYHFISEYRYYLQSRFVDSFVKNKDFLIIKKLLSHNLTNRKLFVFLLRYTEGVVVRALNKRRKKIKIKPLFKSY